MSTTRIGTSKSGWCIDEVQAMDFDMPALARLRHRKCRSDTCDCPGHAHDRQEASTT